MPCSAHLGDPAGWLNSRCPGPGDLGDQSGQAWTLNGLGLLQQLTGDHAAAAASHQQALGLYCDLGHLPGQAYALNSLGVAQQETGDYPAAAASQQQALALFRDARLMRHEALSVVPAGDDPSRRAG